MRRLKIFTWHVHGNYQWYLSQVPHDFYLPVGRTELGYGGRGTTFPFGENVHDLPVEVVRDQQFDCILFQHRQHFERDQYVILSDEQRGLPQIYLEHDPPQQHPTNTKHWVDDANVLLVHVTPFNALMWDSGQSPWRVIDHGVLVPGDVLYSGQRNGGVVVINNLRSRGRRLGLDVFMALREEVPLDLAGMASEELGGMGCIEPLDLPALIAQYRFFFNPIRYTSLGLAVIEAMTIGLPIVGLATTEMVTTIQNGESGIIDTNLQTLLEGMRMLLVNPEEARRLGTNARRFALERFNIHRFVRDWRRAFADVTMTRRSAPVKSARLDGAVV